MPRAHGPDQQVLGRVDAAHGAQRRVDARREGLEQRGRGRRQPRRSRAGSAPRSRAGARSGRGRRGAGRRTAGRPSARRRCRPARRTGRRRGGAGRRSGRSGRPPCNQPSAAKTSTRIVRVDVRHAARVAHDLQPAAQRGQVAGDQGRKGLRARRHAACPEQAPEHGSTTFRGQADAGRDSTTRRRNARPATWLTLGAHPAFIPGHGRARRHARAGRVPRVLPPLARREPARRRRRFRLPDRRHRGDDRGAAALPLSPGRRSATRPASSAATIPKEYGGGGHKGFQRIATQEMGRAGVPYMINVIGLGMAAPTILDHGTEEQKRRYLPPLLAADEIWCQGFSEPGAGSDLAERAGVGGARRRQLDHQRPQGVDQPGALRELDDHARAAPAPTDKYNGLTYFIVPIAGADGRHRAAAHQDHRRDRLQRGAVRGRRRARHAARRRGRQGLDRWR